MFHNHKAQNDRMDKYRSLLEDLNVLDEKSFINLSEGQKKALDLVNDGKNVLIIGAGGTGKSALIREIKYQTEKQFPNKKIVLCGTTGISSYTIGGITINSFMGMGTGEHPVETLIKRIRRKIGIRERIRQTDVLVIDEISMASAELFEKINTICQSIRKSSAPFGGIQVILTGDFFQLLPVFNKNDRIFPNQDTRLIFESPVFLKYFTSKNTIQLTENFRQDNQEFIQFLMRIRTGEFTEDDIKMIMTRMCKESTDESSVVHLVSSNKQAQIINMTNMVNLQSDAFEYRSKFEERGDPEVSSELAKELHSQFTQKGINHVTLKLGARVMLIKNLNVEDGLVNGSVGTIVSFESLDGMDYPVVQFDNGMKQLIVPVEWELELDNSSCKAIQLPLMLCWAITIHKCQSLTLDKAIMDLSECFCEAQVYVALSRVRSMSGVFINSFDPKKILVNQKVKRFLSQDTKL